MKFASALSAACLLPCLALLPHAAMSAPAPITLRCHQDYVFKPHLPDVDLVPGSITSSDPTVAKGSAGRVGIGTAGAIEIDAQGTSGEATITYQVQYADGTIQTIKVKVKVNCPEPQPQPQPRPQPHPQPRPPPPPPHLPPPPTTPPPPPSSGPSEGSPQTPPKGGSGSADAQQRARRAQIRAWVDRVSHSQRRPPRP